MALEGGSWIWAASLRYIFLIPMLLPIVYWRKNLAAVFCEIKRNPEIVQAQEPVKASEHAVEEQPQAHTEAEAETFAADVVEVTEQVAESEKAQPEAEVVAQPEPVVEETPEPVAIVREELPLPEDVNAEEVSPEEWCKISR